jgi:UDP-N-acetyl-D-mannosaminuronate dehydrogenase
VIGYEIDEDKIKRLNDSESNRENKNLFITNDPMKIRDADFVIISVPTPVTRSQEPDLGYVESAAETISENMKQGSVVILESNFLRKNLVKPSDIPLRSSQIIARE